MSKFAARLALVFALVGLGASVAAAYVHYRLLYDPRYLSFCDVNQTISCTQVYLSRFSTVRGIPVAVFGALWFVVAAPAYAKASPGISSCCPRSRSPSCSISATRHSSC